MPGRQQQGNVSGGSTTLTEAYVNCELNNCIADIMVVYIGGMIGFTDLLWLEAPELPFGS